MNNINRKHTSNDAVSSGLMRIELILEGTMSHTTLVQYWLKIYGEKTTRRSFGMVNASTADPPMSTPTYSIQTAL